MSRNPLRLSQAKSSQGYTIDQTILIVAIIAILVTLIIITVGWNLINKTSGTKLASQLRQIEDANGQFYSTYRTWADQSYTGTTNATRNLLALTADSTIAYNATVSNSSAGTRNFLPGFSKNATPAVVHNFGSGTTGVMTMARVVKPFDTLPGTYLVIQMNNVPFSEVLEAEHAIDGESNTNTSSGRVVAVTGGTGNCLVGSAVTGLDPNTTSGSTLANVCYAANLVQ